MKMIFISLIFVLFTIVISSCGGDDSGVLSCSDEEECPNINGTYEFCCTSTFSDCYYKAGSKKFECDGDGCSEAAQELYDYCNAEGSIED